MKKGDAIEIPADVLGLPIPKIEWSKDDVIIQKPTESLLMETETTGRMNCTTKLSVPSANRRDRGNYTVTASNNMGCAKHTVSVMVLGELKQAPAQQSATFCPPTALCSSADRPLPPRNLAVSSIKAESCYLHWDAPVDNGGSELTNYIVEKMKVLKEEPDLEEGEEPPKPHWEEVTNSIIERKYGVCISLVDKNSLKHMRGYNHRLSF